MTSPARLAAAPNALHRRLPVPRSPDAESAARAYVLEAGHTEQPGVGAVAAVADDPTLRLSTTSFFSAVSTTGLAFIGSATTAATNLMLASWRRKFKQSCRTRSFARMGTSGSSTTSSGCSMNSGSHRAHAFPSIETILNDEQNTARLNIQHFRKLLAQEIDKTRRYTILRLLARLWRPNRNWQGR